MPLSNPITKFGIHQATITDRKTHEQFTMVVLGDFNPALTEEQIPLNGGSSPFPFDVASGRADATLSFMVKQFDLNILKYFAGMGGGNFTEDADGEANGGVSALVNKIGDSVFKNSTGIESVGIASGANPVFGSYLIKAVSATTVDVYLDNNLDGVPFVNDSLKITETPLTISGSAVTIPGTGLQLTGGAGTIALTTGDIAQFSARPKSNYFYEYLHGAPGASKPEFSLTVFHEKLDGNKYRASHYPRVKANGIEPAAPEKDWSSFESELIVMYDPNAGYAAKDTVINR